jgi:hypothetical protein
MRGVASCMRGVATRTCGEASRKRDGPSRVRDGALCMRDGALCMRDGALCMRDGASRMRDGASRKRGASSCMRGVAMRLRDEASCKRGGASRMRGEAPCVRGEAPCVRDEASCKRGEIVGYPRVAPCGAGRPGRGPDPVRTASRRACIPVYKVGQIDPGASPEPIPHDPTEEPHSVLSGLSVTSLGKKDVEGNSADCCAENCLYPSVHTLYRLSAPIKQGRKVRSYLAKARKRLDRLDFKEPSNLPPVDGRKLRQFYRIDPPLPAFRLRDVGLRLP